MEKDVSAYLDGENRKNVSPILQKINIPFHKQRKKFLHHYFTGKEALQK
jgi:hypothetical protein